MELQKEDIPLFLNNSNIILDTNFFIDSFPSSNRKAYGQLIKVLKDLGVVFVSTYFIKCEFIMSKTIDVVREKTNYYEQIVETHLPFRDEMDRYIFTIIEDYKQYMEGLPLTDLVSAAYLKKYHGLYLLTRDHRDFPTTVFERMHVFNIGSIRDIRTYGIYAYKPEKTILEEIPF